MKKFYSKELIIHIGLHKTGTSAIQNFFFENRDTIENWGIKYPVIGEFKTAHHEFAENIINLGEKTPLNIPINDFDSFYNDKANIAVIKHIIEEKLLYQLDGYYDKVFLSSENIVQGEYPLEKLISFLPFLEYFENIKIILFLRRQDDLLESAYKQMVCQNFYQGNILNCYLHDFYYFIRSIPDELLTKFNFNFKIYDKSLFKNKNLIEDFLFNFFEIDLQKLSSIEKLNIKPYDKVINPSLSAPGVRILSEINKLDIEINKKEKCKKLLFDKFNEKSLNKFSLIKKIDRDQLFLNLRTSNKLLDKEILKTTYFSNLDEMSYQKKNFISYRESIQLAKDLNILKDINFVLGNSLKEDI